MTTRTYSLNTEDPTTGRDRAVTVHIPVDIAAALRGLGGFLKDESTGKYVNTNTDDWSWEADEATLMALREIAEAANR